MFDTQFHRKLWLAAAAAGFLTVAGCSNQATNEAAATPEKAEPPKAASVSNKAPQPATMVTVPKGTAISATVGQTLASNKNHVGDSVVKVKNKELKVTLASVELRGKSYELETNSVAQSAKNQSKNNAKDSAKTKGKTDTKDKKDVTTLPAQSRLSFKLAKAVSIPVKG